MQRRFKSAAWIVVGCVADASRRVGNWLGVESRQLPEATSSVSEVEAPLAESLLESRDASKVNAYSLFRQFW
jgi:hypothetical protein